MGEEWWLSQGNSLPGLGISLNRGKQGFEVRNYAGYLFPQGSQGGVGVDMRGCHGVICVIGGIFELIRIFDFHC